jgi:hypothetical protein
MSRAGIVICGLGAVALACHTSTPDYTAPGPGTKVNVPDAGPPQIGCSEILTCLNGCTVASCQTNCESQGTMAAQQLFAALDQCVNTTCSSNVGSVCDIDSPACQTCLQNAESSSGTCSSQLAACEASVTMTPTGTGISCGSVVNCLNGCTDASCQTNCESEGSSTAQQLLLSLENCLNSVCPSDTGGVCSTDSTACQSCVQDAQASTGACNSAVSACDGDTSGGGGTCSELITCLNNCGSNASCDNTCEGQASGTAQQDFHALASCLVSACPETSGGVCATETSACDTCLQSAQMSGGACVSQFDTCASS